MTVELGTRLKIKAILVVLLLSVGLYGWSALTTPHGNQFVQYAPSAKECFEGKSTSPEFPVWKYCVHRAQQGTNENIAYLLHGRNLDEHTWNDDTFYTSLIQKRWTQTKAKPPIVVTVSFGPIWLLTPKLSLAKTGLLEVFEREVIPTVEARVGAVRDRLVFGESMGGLNALSLVLQTKGLFKKAAILCPAIYVDSPFASLEETQKFLKRTGADPKIIFGIRTLAREYIATEDEWKRVSPLDLLKSVDSSKLPELYLSCGLYDKYGNFEGSERFSEVAAHQGAKLQWRPLYGGHCVTDIVSLADFLVN